MITLANLFTFYFYIMHTVDDDDDDDNDDDDDVELNVLGCRVDILGTNRAWFNVALRPQKP